ncbi:MAG: hypothetical protein WC763_01255 [Candidatus Paceibacterota bacterium]|jgi:hypothetical protein
MLSQVEFKRTDPAHRKASFFVLVSKKSVGRVEEVRAIGARLKESIDLKRVNGMPDLIRMLEAAHAEALKEWGDGPPGVQ